MKLQKLLLISLDDAASITPVHIASQFIACVWTQSLAKSGSPVHPAGRASSDRTSSSEAIEKQHSPFGRTAGSVWRPSYWLVILVLSLASSSRAHAAADDWRKTEVRNPVTLDLAKVPKTYPADFPGLGLGEPEDLRLQQPTLNSDLEFGFPGATPLNQVVAPTPTALFPGEETTPSTVADAALTQPEMAQTAGSADEMPWRFNFEPFFYLPFGANGDVTVRGINAPINAGIGDIFDAVVNDLNFAAFGRFEAWNGPWGIIFGGAYTNLGTGRTADISVPPVLQQVGLPPQTSVSAAAGTAFTQLDLGGAYRFGDGNLPTALKTADSEFDLGPFIFDALAGLRLYSFNNELVLTDPLGNQFSFSQSSTIVEPMVGGQARWNLSPNLAALASASMSGFGIGDLTFSAAGFAGIDWLFSGNTSLLASYGFTYLNYSNGSSGLDLFTHGPRIGVEFRF